MNPRIRLSRRGARAGLHLLFAFLMAMSWAGSAQAAVGDAGAPTDAATRDAGPGDAGVDQVQQEQQAALRDTLGALQALLAGKPPEGRYLDTLFTVDLTDEQAVTQQREALRIRIAELEKTLEAASRGDAGLDAGATGAPDAQGVGDAGARKGVLDAGAPDAASRPEAWRTTQRALLAVELDVERARLAFLMKPPEERAQVARADAERKRVKLEQHRANDERERALAEQRAAEEARRRALEEAERARTELKRIVANENAKAEGVRAAQAGYKRTLAEQRQRMAQSASDRQTRMLDLLESAQRVHEDAPKADALYAEIVTELADLREQVRVALDAYENVPSAGRYEPEPAYREQQERMSPEDREAVRKHVEELTQSALDLEASARQMAWEHLATAVDREHRLNAARIELLNHVTPGKRDAVLGFGHEGLAQLQRELVRLGLEARWYRVHGEVRLRSARDLVRDPLWIGRVTTSVVLLIGVVIATVYARRQGPGVLERGRVALVRTVRKPLVARPLAGTVAMLQAVFVELTFLLAVLAARWALGSSAELVELAVPLRLLLWYAAYRLVITAAHRAFAWAAAAGASAGAMTDERSKRILCSVRLVTRFGFAVGIVLTIASDTLGKGYLYALVREFAWLGALPLFAVLIRWWRDSISDAYLRHRPNGTLADLVRSTRRRWFGFFVAVAAFAVVFGQATLRTARSFVMGFEQTRKALAFLFRRRLERQAAATSVPPSELALPEDLLRWFSETPVSDENYAIRDLHGMQRFNEELEAWTSGTRSALMLVIGDRAFGKTSWLRAAVADAEPMAITFLTLEERVLTGKALLELMIRGLGLGGVENPTVEAIAKAIASEPRRLVVLDDLHHLLLRGVGTMQAWDTLAQLIDKTRRQVFWLGAMDRLAYQHLVWMRRGAEPFRTVVQLSPWSESRVGLLLSSRTRESEYEVVYDDLVVDRMEGVEGQAQLVSTQQEYTRLIWDYADGCPRVALHCWKNSLVPDGPKRVRVRLFKRPDSDQLERLSEVEKFLLAGVVWHGSITLQEAQASLRFSQAECQDALDRLREMSVLEQVRDRFRVVTRWLRPAYRYLQRKHLIEP